MGGREPAPRLARADAKTAERARPILAATPLRGVEFERFSTLILEKSGIVLNASKRALLEGRLARRLRALGLTSWQAYWEHLTEADPAGRELGLMLNCVTTNKTEFFREPHHFDFLREHVLPALEARAARGAARTLRIWSAGCSSGEEPYTIAMHVLDRLTPAEGWSVEILATDLDTQVLEQAAAGVYPEAAIEPVPGELRRRWFVRGTHAHAGQVRVRRELRRAVEFRHLNLAGTPWALDGAFDLIFCRNVMIYFGRETQNRLVGEFAERLVEGGHLFLGHSESLQTQLDRFEPLQGTVYRRRTRAGSGVRVAHRAAVAAPRVEALRARAIPETTPVGPTCRRLRRMHVVIGGVRASATPVRLRTVLGSCVTACLYDPIARVGGINHFMLPVGLEDREMPTRYGVHAMEVLINAVVAAGADRRRLKAKAFGAAHVLAHSGMDAEVPRRNAGFVREFLEREEIPLVSERLGGSAPVEVLFDTHTGRAFVRALQGPMLVDLAREESRFDLQVRRELQRPPEDAATLF